MEEIRGRHFLQTAERAGLPKSLARNASEEVRRRWRARAISPDGSSSQNAGIAQRRDEIYGSRGQVFAPGTIKIF
jgi:hypothetical protein